MKKLLFIILLLLIPTVSYAMTVGEEDFKSTADRAVMYNKANSTDTKSPAADYRY